MIINLVALAQQEVIQMGRAEQSRGHQKIFKNEKKKK